MRCRAAAFHGQALIAEATVELDHSANTVSLHQTREAVLTDFYIMNSGIASLREGCLKLEYYLDRVAIR
jgi:hypothetical protein